MVGGPGRDFLGFANGLDHVRAGSGDDRLKTQTDGLADVIKCGPGDDRLVYYFAQDPLDVVHGCEHVVVR
jgi:hypothetical protein